MLRLRSIAIAALAVLALAGCKKKDAAPAVDTTTPAPPPAATLSTIELGRHIGANRRVTDTTSVFAVRDTFYLAVVSENTAPGAMLTAKWSFQTGQLVDSTAQPIAAPDAANSVSVTEFHINKPSRWPAGTYKVEVLLDGVSKGMREFTVKR